MSYLGKAKKSDLRILAAELGEDVTEDLKVIELKRLITESDSYEEEFVRNLLESIVSDRLEKEKQEKEREQKEKEREQKEKEREQKEKERIFELEKQEKERIFELEKQEKERIFEIERQRLEIECIRARQETIPNRQIADVTRNVDLQKLLPKFNPKADDISLFLELFERQVKGLQVPEEKWVSQVIGVLPSEIVNLIAREPEEETRNYQYVKSLLLQRFKLSPEKFRQLFVKLQKTSESTWYDFYYELKTYFEGWLTGLEIETFDQLKELMLVDQIKKRIPNDFKEHYLDEWTKITSPKDLVSKIEEFEDVRKCIGPRSGNAVNPREKSNYTSAGKPQYDYHKRYDKAPPAGSWRERDGWQREKKPENDFEKRRKPQCYECGSFDHLRPQCEKLRATVGAVNRLCKSSDDKSLAPYTFSGKINGFSRPILRDTGATVDVVCQKYVPRYRFTGDRIWVQHLLDEKMTCLPLAEVDIECELGCITATAAVIRDSLDPGHYILGNQTAKRLEEQKENSCTRQDFMNGVVARRQQKKSERDTKSKPLNRGCTKESVHLRSPEKDDILNSDNGKHYSTYRNADREFHRKGAQATRNQNNHILKENYHSTRNFASRSKSPKKKEAWKSNCPSRSLRVATSRCDLSKSPVSYHKTRCKSNFLCYPSNSFKWNCTNNSKSTNRGSRCKEESKETSVNIPSKGEYYFKRKVISHLTP